MKSDRRHELQHNQLADAVELWIERVRPYGRLVAGMAVLLVVLGLSFAYVSSKGAEKVAAGWDEYFEAFNSGDRAKLTEVSERFNNTAVAPWARISAADMALTEGCAKLFTEKAEARDLLKQAVDNYQSVLGTASDDTLKQRALFGLARAHESLGDLDDLKKANEDYTKLVDSWPDGVYSVAAKSRLTDLERHSTKEFYDWFAKHEPRRTGAAPGKKPAFLEESLDNPDIKLPSAVDGFKPDAKPSKEGEKRGTESLIDELLSPDDKAEDSPTSEEKPAETPAPSTETPPAEEPTSK